MDTLTSRPNVTFLGALDADDLPGIQAQATVGIIPFRQISLMRASLPLKAYEYIASGLPVVTIPIVELERHPDLFRTATSAAEFAREMEDVAVRRDEPQWLEHCAKVAESVSYQRKFETVIETLGVIAAARAKSNCKYNVVVLYDSGSTHVATIREHLEALGRYSKHHIHYLPATGAAAPDLSGIDLDMFDVAILHYSVRLSIANHLIEPVASALERFNGLKIAFLQDEYDTVNIALGWLQRLRIRPSLQLRADPGCGQDLSARGFSMDAHRSHIDRVYP